jgi:hypothetical protein
MYDLTTIEYKNKMSREEIEENIKSFGYLVFEAENQEQFHRMDMRAILELLYSKKYRTHSENKRELYHGTQRRSLIDAYRLCANYCGGFQGVRFENVFKIIMEMCMEKKLGGILCPDVNRFVLKSDYVGAIDHNAKYLKNEFGYKGIKQMIIEWFGEDYWNNFNTKII